jgi:TolB-like protein/Flp pilus assembly protein TadD
VQDESKRLEDLQRKSTELKRKTYEEELIRVGQEAEQGSRELLKKRLEQDELAFQAELKAAMEIRRRQEEDLRKRQQEIVQKLADERRKKEEAKRRVEEERKRKEDAERKRIEDEERRKKEEEARRKAEEDRKRIVEETRKKAEEDRRRKEEELRRQEEERRQKEEENRKRREEEVQRKKEERREQEEEKLNRIRSLVNSARVFFENGLYDNASVEIAKALVNDPKYSEALALQDKIHEAQGKKKKEDEVVQKPITKEAVSPKGLEEEAPKKKSKTPLYAVLGIAAAILLVIIFFQLKKRVFFETASFAVMPWQSSSGDDEEAAIGSSLAGEVVACLQQFKQSPVMGYASSNELSGHLPNAAQAAFQLGYQYVLQGTLSRSGDGFSIALELIDSTGEAVWNNQYQKKVEDLSSFPGELTQQLLTSLKVSSEEQPLQPMNPIASKPEAYLAYLQGKERLYHQTDQSTKAALELFKQAYQLDEKFAGALAAAASVQATRMERGWDTDSVLLEQAMKWAELAVDINGSLGAAHLALGKVLAELHDFDGALKEFDTASKLLPNNSEIILHEANVLLSKGKLNAAADALKHAFELDPRDPNILETFAYVHQLKGTANEGYWYHAMALSFVEDSTDYLIGPVADAILFDPELTLSQRDRVAEACERRAQTNPNDYASIYRLARMIQSMGEGLKADTLLKRAESILRKETQVHPKNTDAMMYFALTLTRLGRFPEAITIANKAAELEKGNATIRYKIAQMYSLQMYSQKKKIIDAEIKDEALKALREAIAIRYKLDELTSADFYNLRTQPEFRALIAQARQ